MKSKIWITSLLISAVILGGCSASDSGSNKDETMDHSNMTEEEMSGMDGMEGMEMEGDQEPVALNNSTGDNELAIPPLLEPENEEGTVYDITAQKGTTEFFDGVQTETYGYNGAYLGPVVRITKGDTVKLRTKNDLSEETTFHWHGLDVPGGGDGGPHQLVQPGETKEVEFTVNQEASTLWFHPHPEGATAKQVYNGLAGLIYVEDENSKTLSLPDDYGVNDFPLVFQDRQFNEDKQLDYQAVENEDGTTGDTLLINGTLNPKLTVGREKIRFRLLNGSNAREYTFKLNTGGTFQQVATDGGFLNEPIEVNEITLTAGERAEIIVDFSKYDSTNDVSIINEKGAVLLPFKIDEQTSNSVKLPEELNDYAVTDEERNLPVTKKIELFGMGNMVTINGKKFDINRIDFTQKQGDTEIWEIYNKPDMMGGMTHPFHIHGTQFKIVSIDGKEPSASLQGWKDTVAIAPDQKIKLAVKFNNTGIYMFHCHILEHEENGMMGQVEVN